MADNELINFFKSLTKDQKNKLQNITDIEDNNTEVIPNEQDNFQYNPNSLAFQQYNQHINQKNRDLNRSQNIELLRGTANALANLYRSGKDLGYMKQGAGPTKLPRQSYLDALAKYSQLEGEQGQLADQFQQFKLQKALTDEELKRRESREDILRKEKQEREDILRGEKQQFEEKMIPLQTDEYIRRWWATQGKTLERKASLDAAKDQRTAKEKNLENYYKVKNPVNNKEYWISKSDYDQIINNVRSSNEIKDLIGLYSRIGQPVPQQQYDLMVQRYALQFYEPINVNGEEVLVPKTSMEQATPAYIKSPPTPDYGQQFVPKYQQPIQQRQNNNDPLGLGL